MVLLYNNTRKGTYLANSRPVWLLKCQRVHRFGKKRRAFMSYTRIWITGSNGRLGSALCKLLTNIEYQIMPSDIDVPIGESEAVNHFADMNHPDVIINCAGFTKSGVKPLASAMGI